MPRLELKQWILFEDPEHLVINKPPGISTLDDRSGENNVLSIIKDLLPKAQVCHRLDKDTSGVLLIAKNSEVYRNISMQFQYRSVYKEYHAIVHGQTDFNDFEVNVPLIVKNHGIVKWENRVGKESITLFTTVRNFNNYSLVRCNPITGRRHQIRVHLKSIKHPILGDTAYGGEMVYLSQLKRNFKKKEFHCFVFILL